MNTEAERIAATHPRAFLGIQPGAASIYFEVIDVSRIADGCIAECWRPFDGASFVYPPGAISQPEHA